MDALPGAPVVTAQSAATLIGCSGQFGVRHAFYDV
jgi:uncharacterized protein YgbK (DUF1537 family)